MSTVDRPASPPDSGSETPPNSSASSATDGGLTRLLICGPPNVGKSLIFNRLTGKKATVSNYPGTTVTVSSGTSTLLPGFRVSDSPGMYSLLPVSDEERVAREIVLGGNADVVLQVADTKNLRRMLPMTLELREQGLPVVLVLNMTDEARRLGVTIDNNGLGRDLGIPVVSTVATTGEGLDDLSHVVRDGVRAGASLTVEYSPAVMKAVGDCAPDQVGRRIIEAVESVEDAEARGKLELAIRLDRQAFADRILARHALFPPRSENFIARVLDRITLNMWTAIPLAFLVLYVGVYKFVGQLGAGDLVDLIESGIYEAHITPVLTRFFEWLIPWPVLQDLFVHDYGILTLGLRYAVALILPIVGTFFLMFSVLEDSGYLPRLALLLDKVFKKFGLNGRAVIPIVIGFGCGTMATVVTRILETKRERIIATLLLGFAIPCSAQLGVVMAMTATNPAVFVSWCGIMAGIFVTLGVLAARHIPGEAPSFYLEMAPLRMPRVGNVLLKTYSRMHWYFLEILPLFLLASVVIWVGTITGVFEVVVGWMKPLVHGMGLPDQAAPALLFGFFRRDYGAAGLFDMQQADMLNARQTLVSVLVITLFLPCIAQFFVMKKERGWPFAIASLAAILGTAMAVGLLTNFILIRTGWLG